MDDAPTQPSRPPPLPSAGIPGQVGHYRVVRKIGEGGMGSVFEAEQVNPRRTVALKLVHNAVVSEQAARRFELEAQVLGRLQHPGIAQIFEADQFDSGTGVQPFFAMEYIDGEPLTDYADRKGLSAEERLRLLARVCDAVHHAHQRGVIHRDLKPGNILVTSEGQPKVLDFGIARATDCDLQATTLRTDAGQLVGTIPYMSPEQASGDPDQLDTRSDVYSLGVLAYELLSGHLPHDMTGAMVHEAVRMVREDEPRSIRALVPALKGDVETIVAKALAKEVDRRYVSASALAADIRRFLSDEPITARPASAVYQMRKFARRNRALVGGAVTGVLALVVGLIGTAVGLVKADREAERANQTATFLTEILEGVDPAVAQGKDTALMKQVLDQTAERIETELREFPLVEAKIRSTLGNTYSTISEYQAAVQQFERAVAIRLAESGPRDEDTIQERSNLALARGFVGDLQAQERDLLELHAFAQEVLGEDHPKTDAIACHLGVLFWELNREDEAAPYLEKSLAYRRRVYGDNDDSTLIAVNSLGLVRIYQNDSVAAEALLREALERRMATDGPSHPDTIIAIHNLAGLYSSLSRHDESEVLYKDALERAEAILGPDHEDTITALKSLGLHFKDVKDDEQAENCLTESLRRSRKSLGAEHPVTWGIESDLADLFRVIGRAVEAAAMRERLIETYRGLYGPEHAVTIRERANLASDWNRMGRTEESHQLYLELLEIHPRVLGPDDPDVFTLQNDLGLQFEDRGQLDRAEELFRQALAGRRRTQGETDFDTLVSMACLANIFRDTGRHQDEVELRAEVVEGFGQHSGGSDSEAFSQARRLTAILQGLPTVAGREDEIRVLLSHQRRHEAEPDPLARTLTWLGEALSSQERFEAAEEALQEALDLQMETDNYTGPDALRTLMAMAESLQGQERLDEAEPLYIECWDELPESDLARRKKVAQALADLYGALGDSESAEQWLAEISETARAIGR